MRMIENGFGHFMKGSPSPNSPEILVPGLSDEEKFTVVDAGDGNIALHNAGYNRYIRMKNGEDMDASDVKDIDKLPADWSWERFQVLDLGMPAAGWGEKLGMARPPATSCRGLDCRLENQFCPSNAAGSMPEGRCCKAGKWKDGPCGEAEALMRFGMYGVDSSPGVGWMLVQSAADFNKLKEKFLKYYNAHGLPLIGTFTSTNCCFTYGNHQRLTYNGNFQTVNDPSSGLPTCDTVGGYVLPAYAMNDKLWTGTAILGEATGCEDGNNPAIWYKKGADCTVADGSGRSDSYPCTCGTGTCSTNQWCFAKSSECLTIPLSVLPISAPCLVMVGHWSIRLRNSI